ncbi:hypothetical protein Hanom_Chr09g00850031 [Helianthus anomalus]
MPSYTTISTPSSFTVVAVGAISAIFNDHIVVVFHCRCRRRHGHRSRRSASSFAGFLSLRWWVSYVVENEMESKDMAYLSVINFRALCEAYRRSKNEWPRCITVAKKLRDLLYI